MLIPHIVWAEHGLLNRLQSALLLAVMAAFMALLGWLLWGPDGVTTLLFTLGIILLLNPAVSPKMVMRLYQARPLSRDELPELFDMVEGLARRAELPAVPRLYYVPSRMVNAFSVGTPDNSAIAVTGGLLDSLTWRQLGNVLAHEISHIRNRDTWVMGIADLFSRMTSFMSVFGQILLFVNLPALMMYGVHISWPAVFLLIFAPNLSALAQLALSRTREYDADLNGARLTGDPEGLAEALARIERAQQHWLKQLMLPGMHLPEPSLLRTHPATEERIRRLRALQQAEPMQPAFRWPDLPIRHHLEISDEDPRWRHAKGLWH